MGEMTKDVSSSLLFFTTTSFLYLSDSSFCMTEAAEDLL